MPCSSCGGSTTAGKPTSSGTSGTKSGGCSCDCQDAPATLPCTDMAAGGLERVRFFDGMVLTAADLADEQRFWRTKRKLTNRALGQGVVWGLRAAWDARAESFTLQPGYALDCCGNDLVVSECMSAAARPLLDRRNPAVSAILASAHGEAKQEKVAFGGRGTARAHLVLKYAEGSADPRAVTGGSCAPKGGATRYEAARVRESVVLCLAPVGAAQKTALSAFAAELDALKSALTADDLALLFPPGKEAEGSEEGPPLHLLVRRPDDAWTFDPVGGGGGWRYDGGSVPAADGLTLELRAARGWVIVLPSTVKGAEGATLSDAEAPFADALVWGVAGESGESAERSYHAEVTLARLFEPTRRVRVRVHVAIAFSGGYASGGLSQGAWGELHQESDTATAAAPRCLGNLGPDTLLAESETGAPTDPRALVLGLLYGWLSASMAGATGSDGTDWSGARVTAHELLLVAWRLLYGANAAVDGAGARAKRSELARLLQNLVQGLCWGLVYPGPRCTTDHHGVVLGTVTLSASGRVLGFDPWDGRRHVLTGPLLNHWLGQVGLAAPDVVVGRLASAICCVAGLPQVTLPELPDLERRAEGQASASYPRGAVFASGGSTLLFDELRDVQERLAQEHVVIEREETVGPFEFGLRLVQMLTDGSQPENGAVRWTRVAGAGGAQLHLLLPGSRPAPNDGPQSFAPEKPSKPKYEWRALVLQKATSAAGADGLLEAILVQELATVLVEHAPAPDVAPGGPTLGAVLDAGPEKTPTKTWQSAEAQASKLVRAAVDGLAGPRSEGLRREHFGEAAVQKALVTKLEKLVPRSDVVRAAETVAAG